MTKINIISVIDELDDSGLVDNSERNEINADASLTEIGGVLTIAYSESGESGKCDTLITLKKTALEAEKQDEITVKRTGAVVSEFKFSEGLTHKSLYKIPPYSFDAEIYTKKIRNNLERGIGTLSIIYDMTVGGGKKRVNMKITLTEVKE